MPNPLRNFSYFLFFAGFLVWSISASAQKKPTIVNLISSSKTIGIKKNGVDFLKVYNGVFRQDNSTLRSDSAYFYPQNNSFDAFSNVNINQGDTLNIYSDLLNYNGNTKLAKLTNNVRLVDKDATLTTNYLTYNTATRIGIYTGGGKLVNTNNTLTSKNGYYFANSRDSYFRYDVVLTSPDALIKTDTMRYNTGSKVAFFYGPTNIYGKDDTLYTENGRYDTQVQQAFFGKKNQYKQGTKTLNGDSLFYDRVRGYGRAVKNITFNDREQNITLKGDLATHYKSPERTVVSRNAYVVIVTEGDSVKKQEAGKDKKGKGEREKVKVGSEKGVKQANNKTGKKGKPIAADTAAKTKPDTIYLTADTLETRIFTMGELRKMREDRRLLVAAKAAVMKKQAADTSVKKKTTQTTRRIRTRVDSLTKSNGAADYIPKRKPPMPDSLAKKATAKTGTAQKVPPQNSLLKNDSLAKQTAKAGVQKADSVQKKMVKAKADTLRPKPKPIVYTKNARRVLSLEKPDWRVPLFALTAKVTKPGTPQTEDEKRLAANKEARRLARLNADSLSVGSDLRPVPSPELLLKDTVRVRIIMAYHHAKIFKSDVQAKADSMFFSNSDSTMRCYVNPVFWAEGSQLTADTIHFQLKKKKIDNMDMWSNAFVVNTEKDSAHFNQVAGKKMKGYFLNGKLNRMYVDGNAETIYYAKDSTGYQGMNRSISSRIKVAFVNSKAERITWLLKPEQTYYPMDKIPKEKEQLEGFVWKPKERPVSKESIIPNLRKGNSVQKTPVKRAQTPAGKPEDVLKKGLQDVAGQLLNKGKPLFSIPFFMMP